MVHEQLELAEVGAAEDVGDRLAPHAAADHVVELERRVHVEAPLRIGVQRGAVDAERGGEHHLGVQAGRVHSGGLEGLGRLGQRVAQR